MDPADKIARDAHKLHHDLNNGFRAAKVNPAVCLLACRLYVQAGETVMAKKSPDQHCDYVSARALALGDQGQTLRGLGYEMTEVDPATALPALVLPDAARCSVDDLVRIAARVTPRLIEAFMAAGYTQEMGALICAVMVQGSEAALKEEPGDGRYARYQLALARCHDGMADGLEAEGLKPGGN